MSIGVYYWRPVNHIITPPLVGVWVYGLDRITTPGCVNLLEYSQQRQSRVSDLPNSFNAISPAMRQAGCHRLDLRRPVQIFLIPKRLLSPTCPVVASINSWSLRCA